MFQTHAKINPCVTLFWAAFAAANAVFCPSAVAQNAARVFYVSPQGNDQWSGFLPAANAARTDGPVSTPAHARDAVRDLKRQQGGALKQPVVVQFRGGTFFSSEPLTFTAEDSGDAQNLLTYAAYPGEKPILSGGRRITGWKEASVGGKSLWIAEIPEVRDGKWYFRQLWVNGERRGRSRHPNQGYFSVVALPGVSPQLEWTKGQTSFQFKEGDVKAWPTVNQAEVRVMNRWVESHLPVAGVDEAQKLVKFTKKSVFKLEVGDLWYVENALEILDQPGEWFLDQPAGKLYYLPKPGEEMARAEVIAPALAQVIRFDGKPEAGQFVEHLAFRGLTFSHTEWYFPAGFDQGKDKAEIWPPPNPEVGGFGQAAVGVPGAVRGNGVRRCAFEDCGFTALGTYGLELARGCQENRISYCDFGDLGAGGIKLGETAIRGNPAEQTHHNEITDCHIHDGAKIWHSAIGVWIGQSSHNRIVHSHIHDFYYTAISIGWTWGYGDALATNCLVEWNHIHHIGQKSDGDGPILSDMGGIYTLGRHTGTVIRNNLWHDFNGLHYGGWGIYFDEGTSGILAENNLVYRSTHGGFHQHYGRDNIVRNNIFAYSRDWALQRTRQEPHLSFTLERNIVVWDKGVAFGGDWSGGETNLALNHNVYWYEGTNQVRFAGKSFANWQKLGHDTHSLLVNPQFQDSKHDDFTLAPGAPALGLGFKPFDLKGVGVRPKK